MRDVVERLASDLAPDLAQAIALISEAVWWVTLVDATLVRYHHQAYDEVIEASVGRRSIEGTLAGLRFVRNQMGYHLDPADFIHTGQHRPGAEHDHVAAWTWRSLPEPDLRSLPPRGRAWEMTRYRAYQARLAGHTIGDTFGRAAGFLTPIVLFRGPHQGAGRARSGQAPAWPRAGHHAGEYRLRPCRSHR